MGFICCTTCIKFLLMVAVEVFVQSPGTGHQRCDMLLRTFVRIKCCWQGAGHPRGSRPSWGDEEHVLHEQPFERRRSHSGWINEVEGWRGEQCHMDGAPGSHDICRDCSTAYHQTEGGTPPRYKLSTNYFDCCLICFTHVLCPSCYRSGYLLCSSTCTAATAMHTLPWLVIRRNDKCFPQTCV